MDCASLGKWVQSASLLFSYQGQHQEHLTTLSLATDCYYFLYHVVRGFFFRVLLRWQKCVFMCPLCALVLSCLKAPLQLPQFMRPGQIHPCRRVHIVLKHKILHRSWIYSTIGRRMNAWKLDDTFMFMIVVVLWYFYDVGPHSFCHLTPSCPIRLSEISRRWYQEICVLRNLMSRLYLLQSEEWFFIGKALKSIKEYLSQVPRPTCW